MYYIINRPTHCPYMGWGGINRIHIRLLRLGAVLYNCCCLVLKQDDLVSIVLNSIFIHVMNSFMCGHRSMVMTPLYSIAPFFKRQRYSDLLNRIASTCITMNFFMKTSILLIINTVLEFRGRGVRYRVRGFVLVFKNVYTLINMCLLSSWFHTGFFGREEKELIMQSKLPQGIGRV